MVVKRLEKIKFNCHECSNTESLDYDYLNENLKSDDALNLSNISELVRSFICSKCRQKSFEILDVDGVLLFDTNNNVSCEICDLPIPFPRLSASPGTKRCVNCQNSGEGLSLGVQFPSVPTGLRGKCPSCQKKRDKGIVVVYQNSNDKSFFLGCSNFPSCRWSSNEHWNELNSKVD